MIGCTCKLRVQAPRTHVQMWALTRHGAAPAPLSKTVSMKLEKGSAVLQLAKLPIPGLAPIAFMVCAVAKASDAARHLRDDCQVAA